VTATLPPRGRTGLRWGRVYGWDVIDHGSWMAGTPRVVLNDYVGQTRQKGRARENQHRDSQPWSDLTVGSPRVLWDGWCTDEELDEWERHFIQDVPPADRPRLNYLLNEDNPRQVPKWVLLDQRHARDDRRGDQRWEATPYRPEVYGYALGRESVAQPRTAVRRKWRPWQKHLLALSLVGLALWVGTLVAFAKTGQLHGDVWWRALAGCYAVTAWGWFGFPALDKGSGARRRRALRRWRGR
jgi:hypothetical protein